MRAVWICRLALVLAPGVLTSGLRAQGSCSTVVGGKCATIAVPLPNVTSISNPKVLLVSAAPGTSTLTISQAQMDAGTTGAVPLTLTVQANRSWALAVNGPAQWTVSNGGWAGKPISDMRWSIAPSGPGTGLTTSPAVVVTGSPTASSATVLYVRSNVAWATDKPGGYLAGVTFTLSAP